MRFKEKEAECTRELVEAVARQLATRSVRDTDFVQASSVQQDNILAIVQSGINKQISLDTLSDALESWLGVDAIKEQLRSIGIKYNTSSYWNSMLGYIPGAGEIIIYSDYQTISLNGATVNVPGIKIGGGNAYIQDLAFIGQKEATDLINHISNSNIHTSAAEKAFWNKKLNVTDAQEVVEETLIFNRN